MMGWTAPAPRRRSALWWLCEQTHRRGPSMKKISTIGLDTAKRVFQVHGVGESGEVICRRQLRRADVLNFFAKLPPGLVGMEACSSAHYSAREISAFGHDVRLM